MLGVWDMKFRCNFEIDYKYTTKKGCLIRVLSTLCLKCIQFDDFSVYNDDYLEQKYTFLKKSLHNSKNSCNFAPAKLRKRLFYGSNKSYKNVF